MSGAETSGRWRRPGLRGGLGLPPLSPGAPRRAALSGAETAGRWRRPVLRVGLGFLALSQGVIGAWALLGPRTFFDHFPGTALGWVALLPPYNEHLVRDVGALSLALTVLLGYAAVRPEPRT